MDEDSCTSCALLEIQGESSKRMKVEHSPNGLGVSTEDARADALVFRP